MKFKVITLDCPWPYDRTSGQGVANKQYDLMTWDDLYALGSYVKAVAAPDCAIFLWTTAPLLMETVDMVKAWRLRYVTKAFSWVKTYASGGIFFGIGSYTASNTEDVWLLSNGTPKRKAKDVSQIIPTLIKQDAIVSPLTDHSAKPEEMQDRVERLLPGPYLEIFARRQRPGWTCIGNELDGLDVRVALTRLANDQALPVVRQSEDTQASFLTAAP
jgi:N6-adenosine-specific RNA methylase IME4